MNKVMVIKSSEWFRARFNPEVENNERYNTSLLFDKERGSCCLGIHAAFCGIPKEQMVGIATPVELSNRFIRS